MAAAEGAPGSLKRIRRLPRPSSEDPETGVKEAGKSQGLSGVAGHQAAPGLPKLRVGRNGGPCGDTSAPRGPEGTQRRVSHGRNRPALLPRVWAQRPGLGAWGLGLRRRARALLRHGCTPNPHSGRLALASEAAFSTPGLFPVISDYHLVLNSKTEKEGKKKVRPGCIRAAWPRPLERLSYCTPSGMF